MEPEQELAELYRILYKLGIMTFNELDKACDQLTVRMFEKYLKSKEGP